MFSLFSDVAPFVEFLKSIQDGTIVLMATYDDGATKYVNDLYNKYCLKFKMLFYTEKMHSLLHNCF